MNDKLPTASPSTDTTTDPLAEVHDAFAKATAAKDAYLATFGEIPNLDARRRRVLDYVDAARAVKAEADATGVTVDELTASAFFLLTLGVHAPPAVEALVLASSGVDDTPRPTPFPHWCWTRTDAHTLHIIGVDAEGRPGVCTLAIATDTTPAGPGSVALLEARALGVVGALRTHGVLTLDATFMHAEHIDVLGGVAAIIRRLVKEDRQDGPPAPEGSLDAVFARRREHLLDVHARCCASLDLGPVEMANANGRLAELDELRELAASWAPTGESPSAIRVLRRVISKLHDRNLILALEAAQACAALTREREHTDTLSGAVEEPESLRAVMDVLARLDGVAVDVASWEAHPVPFVDGSVWLLFAWRAPSGRRYIGLRPFVDAGDVDTVWTRTLQRVNALLGERAVSFWAWRKALTPFDDSPETFDPEHHKRWLAEVRDTLGLDPEVDTP